MPDNNDMIKMVVEQLSNQIQLHGTKFEALAKEIKELTKLISEQNTALKVGSEKFANIENDIKGIKENCESGDIKEIEDLLKTWKKVKSAGIEWLVRLALVGGAGFGSVQIFG